MVFCSAFHAEPSLGAEAHVAFNIVLSKTHAFESPRHLCNSACDGMVALRSSIAFCSFSLMVGSDVGRGMQASYK